MASGLNCNMLSISSGRQLSSHLAYIACHSSGTRTKKLSVLLKDNLRTHSSGLSPVQRAVAASPKGLEVLDCGRSLLVADPCTALPRLAVICARLVPSDASASTVPGWLLEAA